jgi:hypothetical protein
MVIQLKSIGLTEKINGVFYQTGALVASCRPWFRPVFLAIFYSG